MIAARFPIRFVRIAVSTVVLLACVSCGRDVAVGTSRGGADLGGTGQDWIVGSALDGDGNLYLLGHFDAAFDLGGGLLEPGASPSAFIASFRPDGSHRWSKSYSGSDFIAMHELQVDGDRLRAVGLFRGDMTTDIGLLQSGPWQALLVLEHQLDGAIVNQLGFPGMGGNVQGKSIDTVGDRTGISGSYVGDVDLGLGFLGASLPERDLGILAIYGPAGNAVWTRAIFGDCVINEALSLDASGGVTSAGRFEGMIQLGGGRLAVGSADAYVAGFDGEGSERFVRFYTAEGVAEFNAMALHSNQDVVVGGEFTLALDAEGETFTSVGAFDAMLTRVSNDGTVRWTRTFGTAGNDQVFAVETNGDETLACGILTGDLVFDGDAFTHQGGGDAFAIALDADGNTLWTRVWGGPGLDDCGAINTRDGQVVVSGRFNDTMTVDGEVFESRGGSDVYVLRL